MKKNAVLTMALLALMGATLIAVTACNKGKSAAETQAAGTAGQAKDGTAQSAGTAQGDTPAASAQPKGDGTAGDPYLINTEADLRAIGTTFKTELNYRLMADITLTGDNDNDPDNGNWTPIGGTSGFSGVFDGNGHTITGLRINIPDDFPPLMNGGLFGSVDGRVENLGLIDVNITAGTQGIGGITGLNNGTIQNCYVTGIIGDMYGKGGIAGSNTSGGTIQNCFFAGTVIHRQENISTISGGIAGISNGVVSNCISLAESITEEPENNTVGRIVGKDRIQELTGRLINNYGWNGTSTGQTYLYYVTVPTSADPANKNGADLSSTELKTKAAWEKAGFSFGADSMWEWNGAKGIPGLKNQKAVLPWPTYLEKPATAKPNPYTIGETG